MDIKLIPVEKGSKFTFPALPEKVQGKYAAKYQSFDIISLGTVKVPKGTDVSEFSWDGVFFGASKKNEAIVKTNAWKSPNECVKILNDYMLNETVDKRGCYDFFISAETGWSVWQCRVFHYVCSEETAENLQYK